MIISESKANINKEIKRKLFHLCALFIPLIYHQLPQEKAIEFVCLLFVLTFSVDLLKKYSRFGYILVGKIFKSIMRDSEIKNESFSGTTYMSLGFFASAIFFNDKVLVISSWLILIFSDAIAAIVGIKFGTKKINNKTMVGSLSFLLSSMIATTLCFHFFDKDINFPKVMICCLAVTLLEFISKNIKIDDNFLIPVSFCLLYSYLNF